MVRIPGAALAALAIVVGLGGLAACDLLSDPPATAARPGPTRSDVQLVTEIGLQDSDLDKLRIAPLATEHDFQGVPSLTLCGQTYPSESLRTARRAVRVPGREGLTYANDVTTYVSAAAAAQALAEVRRAAKTCPAGTTAVSRVGTDQPSLPVVPSVLVFATTTSATGVTTWVIEAYQQRGNVLDVDRLTSPRPPTDEQRVQLLRQADVTGTRMTERLPAP